MLVYGKGQFFLAHHGGTDEDRGTVRTREGHETTGRFRPGVADVGMGVMVSAALTGPSWYGNWYGIEEGDGHS
jgi:hypothetical protein